MLCRHASESDEYYFQEGCYILELLNVPEDPDVSIARARVRPGQVTDLHCLEGVTERYVILEGQGRVIIGGVSEDVAIGSALVIPAGVSQSIRNTGTGDLVFLAICSPRFQPDCYRALETGK